ncbi:copper resistance CopC/CopD family protein [Streptomyces sp. NBC_00557]|uniref:copper resistance CopC/CopD family protein n=1 Tax=Streptomyces sp. NBC_00557 TaxID=2975776 RepID=UPI002E81A9AC|nr:copper resistance protein CopC [Streptomyces sp. NBC_00557]WUC35996.1 copper resistance protein CopC [Streptomyces sp. NBC_00557]
MRLHDRHRRWARRFTLLCTGLLLLLIGTAAPASAHAALRTTDPADGTVLRTAPRHITLTFTESVGLLTDSVRVYDPANHRLRTGPAEHAGGSDTARVALPARLAGGTYTVAWRVVSADSHPVSGAFTFSVGKRTATTASPVPDRTENPATAALYNIARYLAYLAVAVLLGTAAFVGYCRPPTAAPLRTPVLAAAWTLLGTTTALYLLRAPYEEGAPPAVSLGALSHTATTRPGALLLIRLALLILAGTVIAFLRARRRRLPRRTTLAVAAAVSVPLALTWTAADHASAGVQVPLAIASATLHLLAMAAWVGGLAAVLRTLRRTSLATVARFSRLAFASVTVLVVTGVYQSWRGLGSWQALSGTTYGRTLLAKLAAVTALLLAAACSRAWTTRVARESRTAEVHEPQATAVREPQPAAVREPQAAAVREPRSAAVRVPEPATGPPLPPGPPAPPPPPAFHILRRSVLAEAAVAAVVLALTTLLTSTAPGRVAEETAAAPTPAAGTSAAGIPAASVTTIPFDAGAGGHGSVQVTLDPGRVGRTSVQAVVYGPDGGLSTVPELRVTLTLAAQRIGPLDTRVTDRGGYWGADSFDLPLPGTWTLKVTVRLSELDQVTVSAPVRVTR